MDFPDWYNKERAVIFKLIRDREESERKFQLDMEEKLNVMKKEIEILQKINGKNN